MLKTGFQVQNHLLNLCSRFVNSLSVFCSKKNWFAMFVLKLSLPIYRVQTILFLRLIGKKIKFCEIGAFYILTEDI